MKVPGALFSHDPANAQIDIRADGATIHLHMVEVRRQ